MDEYISKQSVIDYLEGYFNNCFSDVGTYDGDYKAGDSDDEP